MAKYLLDTCVCISMFRNEGKVRETLQKVGIEKSCVLPLHYTRMSLLLVRNWNKPV